MTESNARVLHRTRWFVAGVHALASIAVATLGALLIFRLWYPQPFDTIAGGAALFLLLVSVDVVLGPALTAIVARPGKRITELRTDIALIVVVQLAAFAYGVYSIALARPVFESFEVDRFRVVVAADVDPDELRNAPEPWRTLPWNGPKLIAAVMPRDPEEQVRSIQLGLSGIDLSMVPSNWRAYDSQRDAAWRAAKPATALVQRYPSVAGQLAKIAAEQGTPPDDLRYLPLVSRHASWVVVLAGAEARPVGYLPVDGFF